MEIEKRKPGRPAGAKHIDRDTTIELPPQCPACQSTRREKFNGEVSRHVFAGEIETPSGLRLYNLVVWHRTRCLDCGQQLMVRTFHFIPGGKQ